MSDAKIESHPEVKEENNRVRNAMFTVMMIITPLIIQLRIKTKQKERKRWLLELINHPISPEVRQTPTSMQELCLSPSLEAQEEKRQESKGL